MNPGSLELLGEPVRAVSVGGLETCIQLPNEKICFDIGRCPPESVRYERVLFTHAHTDHMGGVVHHCASRDMMGMAPPAYFLPAENVEAFGDMLDAWRRLDRSDLPCTVHPVSPGDRIDLGKGRFVDVFRAYHRVPTVGYGVGHTRERLRDDLQGAPRDVIVAKRAAGEDIHQRTEVIEWAFCGDTTLAVLERQQVPRAARRLILEVTFLDDRVSVDASRNKGHIHLDEIVQKAHLLENEAILFTHVSRRYPNPQIRKILRARLPASLFERVTVLEHAAPWA